MRSHLSLKNSVYLLAAIVALTALAGCGGNRSDDPEPQNRGRTLEYTREVAFLEADGDTVVTVGVAVADDDDERNAGLMDVNNLPSDRGMLFIFEDERPRSFWMANTPLPLDILFVNDDREIVRIHQNTQPFSQKNFTSGLPSRYVVEVNAGFCVTHDIREGMRISFTGEG